jgi:hypothetical protein
MVHTPMMNVIAAFVTLQLILISVFVYKYISYTSFYSPWFSGSGTKKAPPALDTDAMLNALEPDYLEPPPSNETNAAAAIGVEATTFASFADAAERKSVELLTLCLDLSEHKERCPGLYKHAVDVLMYDFADLSSTFDLDEPEIVPLLFSSVEQDKYFRDAMISAIALMQNTDPFDAAAPHATERASMFISYHLQWYDETARKIAKYKRGRIAHDQLMQEIAAREEFDRRAEQELAARQQQSKTDL